MGNKLNQNKMKNEIKVNEVVEVSQRLINEVMEGNVNPLEAFVNLKKVEEAIKAVKSEIEDLALTEAAKHPKTFDYLGCEVTQKRAAGRWDFKHIQSIRDAENNVKQLKSIHKTAAGINESVVNDDGEIIEPAIYTEGKDTLSIRIKK